LFRLAITGERQRGCAEGSHVLKNCVLILPVEEVRRSDSPASALGHIFPKGNQAIGVLIRKWTQGYRVYNAEDGGVCANPQRERDHGNSSNARIF
jgi:hypothetical protein